MRYLLLVIFWGGSSTVEQHPFKLLVQGSNPCRLTDKVFPSDEPAARRLRGDKRSAAKPCW